MGLYQGMPEKIPVVEQDFIFSAIAEEMGGIFAICLLMVCISCFLMFFNVAMQMKEQFYKLIALGLGTVYGFQVFLTVGAAMSRTVPFSAPSAHCTKGITARTPPRSNRSCRWVSKARAVACKISWLAMAARSSAADSRAAER